jgi:hypothetical protein
MTFDVRGCVLAGPYRAGGWYVKAYGFTPADCLEEVPGVNKTKDGTLRVPSNMVPDEIAVPHHSHYVHMSAPAGITFRPYQIEAINFLLARPNGGLLALDVGLGKAQPLTELVATPQGWRKMGDLQLGDTVFTPTGTTTVVALSQIQYQQTYKMEFTDGSTCMCTGDHLWYVETTTHRTRGKPGKILTTVDLTQNLRWKNGRIKWYVPQAKPVPYPTKTLPLDPWLLGALIGDGSLHYQPRFTNAETDVVANVRKRLPPGITLKRKTEIEYSIVGNNGALAKICRELNLNRKSIHKHIPTMYKTADINQRLALLQGLMDTDGDISLDGYAVIFNTSSFQLAQDTQELVESLGGTAKIACREQPIYSYKGERKIGQPAYRLYVKLPAEFCPVTSEKHLKRWKPFVKYPPVRGITAIYKQDAQFCRCIKVADPAGLYLTRHYITTHNTAVALKVIEKKKLYPFVVVGPKMSAPTWVADDGDPRKHFGFAIQQLSGRNADEFELDAVEGYFINPEILTSKDKGSTWVDRIKQDIKPKAVIYDEAHNFRNMTSQSIAAMNLSGSRSVEHRMMLTATPIVRSVMDLWALLNFAEPGQWGKRADFGKRYAGYIAGAYGWVETEEINVRELRERVSRVMFRRSRFEVRNDLPPMVRRRVTVPKQVLEAAGCIKKLRDMQEAAARDDVGGTYMIQSISSMASVLSEAKRSVAVNEVKELLMRHKKVLMFVWFKETAEVLAQRLQAEDVAVFGPVTSKTTQRQRNAFMEGISAAPEAGLPNGAVFIATLGSASLSLNKLSCCSATLFVDLYWLPTTLLQGEGRTHREGQKAHEVEIVYLVAEKTIDDLMFKALEERSRIAERIVQDPEGVKLTEELAGADEKNTTSLKALFEGLKDLDIDEMRD